MDIHRAYMARLGITPEEAETANVALDNLSYTSYMLRVAYEEGQAEVAAAILSCAVSYEVIAKKIVEKHPEALNHPFYGEWVSGYVADAYHEENQVLIDLMDRLSDGYSEKQLQHLEEIFTACSRYEMAFWDMAWDLDVFTQVVRLLYTIEALSLELWLSMTELPMLLFHKLMKLLMSVIIFFFALLLKKMLNI